MQTSTWDATLSDVRRCLEAVGLSVLVAALDGSQPSQAPVTTPVLVFTTSGDIETARAAITAGGLGHLLSQDDPPAAAAPGAPVLDLSADPFGDVPPEPFPGLTVRRHLRTDVPASDLPGLSGLDLSAREVEVLRLFANGTLHRQVAHELYVSPKTVKNHLSHIYAKLGVANRTQAVALAVRQGIVSIG